MEVKKIIFGAVNLQLVPNGSSNLLAWYLVFNQTMLLNQVLLVLLAAAAIFLIVVFAVGILAMVVMIVRCRTLTLARV